MSDLPKVTAMSFISKKDNPLHSASPFPCGERGQGDRGLDNI